jgi:hypothetical protein
MIHAMSNTTTSSELTYADVVNAVAGLRGRPVRVTIMEAVGGSPRPVAVLDGVVGGQQADEDFRGVTHTRLRRNGAAGSFALDSERFIAAEQADGIMGMGKVLMVRQGDLMIGIEAD